MFEQMINSQPVQIINERYQAMARREQLAVVILAGFFAVIIVLYVVVFPATDYHDKAQKNYKSALDTYTWMEANKGLVRQNADKLAARDPDQSLLGIANQTSKSFQLSFKRYQPVGENGLSLWLDNVSFNNTILWLERLDKRYNISVKEIAVDRQEEIGVVNVRLVLQG